MTYCFQDLHDALRHWSGELARVAVALNLRSLDVVEDGAREAAATRGTTHFALPIWHRGRCVAWLRAELRPVLSEDDHSARVQVHDELLGLREAIEASFSADDAHAA
jgi:hypothetical protein